VSVWPHTDFRSTPISRHRYHASACLKYARSGQRSADPAEAAEPEASTQADEVAKLEEPRFRPLSPHMRVRNEAGRATRFNYRGEAGMSDMHSQVVHVAR
jgi:hypothetical protein